MVWNDLKFFLTNDCDLKASKSHFLRNIRRFWQAKMDDIFPAIQFDEPIDDGPVSNHTSSTSSKAPTPSKAPTTSKATTSSKRKVTPVDSFPNELETYSQWGKRQKKNKYRFQL